MSKNLKFGQIFQTISILDKIVENHRFWSKSSESLDLGQHFRKISILLNIFGKNFHKSWFGKNFRKISILVKKLPKISILVKIFETSILVKNVKKSQIWSNLSNNLDFGQNCRKFSILVKI